MLNQYQTIHPPNQGPLQPSLSIAVMQVLTYFEIFSHPLTAAEIMTWLPCSEISLAQLETALETGVAKGEIWQFEQYYQSVNEPDWVVQRKIKNQMADVVIPKAHRMGRLIASFPFVRAVMVSGSLSKHVMNADGDIDFFIVTENNRLWLARTFLVLFKKCFLLNSRKYFCVNYFIDTAHLEIEEKNLFTATECASLLPISGAEWYKAFTSANRWVYRDFYPNASFRPVREVPFSQQNFLKTLFERVLHGALGEGLDKAAMRLTMWVWRKKFPHFNDEQFNLSMKSRRYVSKHHPLAFQERVLRRHAELMQGR